MASRKLLDVAYERDTAEIVIENGKLVNVLTSEIYEADIAITQGRIAAIGDIGQRKGTDTKVIDAKGYYLTPGLIDGHLHIECSKLSVTMFADLVSRYGTTSVISGLDQILVSAGIDGVKEFLEESKASPMRIWWGAPAKAPYTLPESNVGHRFGVAQHKIAQAMPECVGLWETVQEFVEEGDEEVLEALEMAENNRLRAFGCAPLVDARRVAGYAASGVALCHESYSPEEELEKMRNGMNILIRESTAAPMLAENIKLVTQMGAPSHRVGFCTDDVTSTDILSRGHLDYVIRLAIEHGVSPIEAIEMATINTARMYGLDRYVGAIAPGRFADILFVEDLKDFRPAKVMAGGKIVAENSKSIVAPVPPKRSEGLLGTFHLEPVDEERICVKAKGQQAVARAIVLSKDVAFKRGGENVKLAVKDGIVQVDIDQDVIMVAVAERYGKTNNLPVAFIKGFGLRRGAIATSASPDDNNVVCAGTNAHDMAIAINEVAHMGGGQVAVDNGEVLARLPLPIGGVVADLVAEDMSSAEKTMDEAARAMGSQLQSAFTQLLFLSITAIPDWAITDLGLIDCIKFEVVDPLV